MVKLIGGGSVINGATPSSFDQYQPIYSIESVNPEILIKLKWLNYPIYLVVLLVFVLFLYFVSLVQNPKEAQEVHRQL